VTAFWNALAAWLVATPFALVIFGFLTRTYINHRLTKELEAYKAGLDEQAERLKTQLSIRAHEESVMISRVDAEKSHAIGDVWGQIRGLQASVSRILTRSADQGPDPETCVSNLDNDAMGTLRATTSLFDALSNNAIYLDVGTLTLIGEFAKASKSLARTIVSAIADGRRDGISHAELWCAAVKVRDEEVARFNKASGSDQFKMVAQLRVLIGTTRPETSRAVVREMTS
jgi:hypothetical protein